MVAGDALYCLFRGDISESGAEVMPQLVRMDLNGQNRRTVCTLPASSPIMGSLGSDDRSLYACAKTFKQKNGTPKTNTELWKIDLRTGKVETICTWEADASIVGAAGEMMFLN